MKDELFPTSTEFELENGDYMAGLFPGEGSEVSMDDDFDLDALNALLEEKSTEAEPEEKIQPKPEGKAKAAKAANGSSPLKLLLNRFLTNQKPGLFVWGAIAAGLICVVLLIVVLRTLDPFDNRILPNTTIGGIGVGGMTKLEAYSALKDATASTFSETPMEVSLPDGTITLTPQDTKVKFKPWSAVSAAFRLGRKGTDEEKLAAVAASENGGSNVDMLPYLKIDQDYIRSQLEAYAAQYNVGHT